MWLRTFLFSISLLLLPTMASSQSVQQPSTEVALKITLPEAEILWKALRKLPVEEVEPLMTKIRQQVSEQTNAAPSSKP